MEAEVLKDLEWTRKKRCLITVFDILTQKGLLSTEENYHLKLELAGNSEVLYKQFSEEI